MLKLFRLGAVLIVKKAKRNVLLKVTSNEEKLKSDLAKLVKTVRKRLKMTQRELAQKAGTTQAVIARLEGGTDERMPSLMLIYRLFKGTKVDLSLLCSYMDNPK